MLCLITPLLYSTFLISSPVSCLGVRISIVSNLLQAVDLWNNRAGCSEGLTASVVLKCSALEPNEMEVPLPESGTARFAGQLATAELHGFAQLRCC